MNYKCIRCYSGKKKNEVHVNQILEDKEKVFEVNALSGTRTGENRQIYEQKLLHTKGRIHENPQGKDKGMASLVTKHFNTMFG